MMNLVEKGKSAELKKVLQASQQQLECQVIDINDHCKSLHQKGKLYVGISAKSG